MGGSVSSGRDNNHLVDNLVEGNYIKTDMVERVFRAVDRADYFTPSSKLNAYKDHAWRSGALHLSAPCIYSDVMEWLKLRAGLSFLNIGSGTGYFSTMAGLILGTNGINHGIELNAEVIKYAMERLDNFVQNTAAVDEFDFCYPQFVLGNCLCLSPTVQQYDRVYCGAACPKIYENSLKNLIKVGGILVLPINDKLVQIKRISETRWASKSIQCVSFATLITPNAEQSNQYVQMMDLAPAPLQVLCRSKIRNVLRNVIYEENPQFKNVPLKSKKVRNKSKYGNARVRTISIPIEDDDNDDSDAGNGFLEIGLFHDLNHDAGSREMNALINYMLNIENHGASSESDSSSVYERIVSEDDNENTVEMMPDLTDHSSSDEDGKLSRANLEQTNNEKQSESNPSEDTCQEDRGSSLVKSFSCSNLAADELEIPSNSKCYQAADESKATSSNNLNPEVSKRDKFDSGIVDDTDEGPSHLGNTSSSPETSTSMEGMNGVTSYISSDEELQILPRFEAITREINNHTAALRSRCLRRLRKRRHRDDNQQNLDEDVDSSEQDVWRSQPIQQKRIKRKSTPPPNPCDVQRNFLSALLKSKVNELPLPMPLKIFVNMNRKF